jgi:hypothetical protein
VDSPGDPEVARSRNVPRLQLLRIPVGMAKATQQVTAAQTRKTEAGAGGRATQPKRAESNRPSDRKVAHEALAPKAAIC